MPDEREKTEEQVEDLEVGERDAGQVKGGSSKNELAVEGIWVPQGSPATSPDKRGGWDGNHNQTLIEI